MLRLHGLLEAGPLLPNSGRLGDATLPAGGTLMRYGQMQPLPV
jgi:hypothetical protein